jgi:hypothetical protein
LRITGRQPRADFRFGFDGPIEGRDEYRAATVDEILESLDRHSQLTDQLSPQDGFEPDESTGGLVSENGGQATPIDSHAIGRGSVGRYGFGLMLVGGVLILMVYGVLRAVTNMSASTTAFVSILGVVLNDPVKLGLLAVLCLVPLVMVRKRHNRIAKQAWA